MITASVMKELKNVQKQLRRPVLKNTEAALQRFKKSCSEKMQQINRRTLMRSNFIEITLRHGCSPVNLPHIFRTSFPKKHLWKDAS